MDLRFIRLKGPLSIEALLPLTETSLSRGKPSQLFGSVAPLETATPEDIAVLHNPKYQDSLKTTQAGAVIVTEKMAAYVPEPTTVLVSEKPLRSFTLLLPLLFEDDPSEGSIHPTAVIDPSVNLGKNCCIGPYAVISEGATLGDDCWIGSHTFIGPGVVLGPSCRIASHVSITHAILDTGVVVKAGTRIGQRGFGFFLEETSIAHLTQLQLGRVLIGKGVEIGSNTTIDRGSLKDTILEDFARIDNSVQIAHNVHVGKGAVLVAQVGIAGSCHIGDYSILAGQVGVAGHLTVGAGARIAAKSGITKDVPPQSTMGGIPAIPIGDWRRQMITLRHLATKTSSLKKD